MAKSAERIATDYTDLMKGRLGQLGRVCSIPYVRDWVWWVWWYFPRVSPGAIDVDPLRGWDFSSKMSSLRDFKVYSVDFIATIILSLRDLKALILVRNMT